MREDGSAGCYFRKIDGWIIFIDHASDKIMYNVIEFYAALHNIDREIAESRLYEVIFRSGKLQKVKLTANLTEHRKVAIHSKYSRRKWNQSDKKYWSQYLKKFKRLQENCFPITAIQMNRKNKRDINITYATSLAYYIKVGLKFKAYCPYCDKKIKFMTNTTQNDIGGVEELDTKKKYVLIVKSFKDWLIMREENANTVWVQNEGMIPDNEVLLDILGKAKYIFIMFDGDRAGIAASLKMETHLKALFKNRKKLITHFDIENVFCNDPGEFLEAGSYNFPKNVMKMIKYTMKLNLL